MWLFFTRRLRMWLILTVLVPLTTGVLRTVGRRLERRNGPTRRQPGAAEGRRPRRPGAGHPARRAPGPLTPTAADPARKLAVQRLVRPARRP